MSARNTFVTSYIYDDEAMDVIENILRRHTDYVLREPHFFAGVLKTMLVIPSLELKKILQECDRDLADVNYRPEAHCRPRFNIAVIGDDDDAVIHRDDMLGLYRTLRLAVLLCILAGLAAFIYWLNCDEWLLFGRTSRIMGRAFRIIAVLLVVFAIAATIKLCA